MWAVCEGDEEGVALPNSKSPLSARDEVKGTGRAGCAKGIQEARIACWVKAAFSRDKQAEAESRS